MQQFARWLTIVLLVSFFGCTMYKERPARSFAEATGGEDLERVFWKNVKDKKWVEIERSMASNFVGSNADGRFAAPAWLEKIKQLDVKEYSIGNLQTELNGKTLVVTYNITMTGTREGQVLSSTPTHRMSIWQQQKSGWILIAQAVGAP